MILPLVSVLNVIVLATEIWLMTRPKLHVDLLPKMQELKLNAL